MPVLSRRFDRLRNRSNKSRGENTKPPLYKRCTKIYFRSPPFPRTESRLFATQIFHVDTFDINSIRQGLVPIHGSAVFNVGARFSAFSLPYAVTGSCSRPVYPASPSHYVQTAVRLAAFVTGNVLFGQASFPDVQREFPATATFHRRAGAPS